MKNKAYIFIIVIVTGLVSCQNDIVYKQTQDLPGLQWHKDSIVQMQFQPEDTIQAYNLFFLIRNDNNYPYANLFLIAKIADKNKTEIDTLEYEMADAKGNWLGSGWDLKESKLIYKTNYKFTDTLVKTFSMQQAVRKSGQVQGDSLLPGVASIGIIIEKANKK